MVQKGDVKGFQLETRTCGSVDTPVMSWCAGGGNNLCRLPTRQCQCQRMERSNKPEVASKTRFWQRLLNSTLSWACNCVRSHCGPQALDMLTLSLVVNESHHFRSRKRTDTLTRGSSTPRAAPRSPASLDRTACTSADFDADWGARKCPELDDPHSAWFARRGLCSPSLRE